MLQYNALKLYNIHIIHFYYKLYYLHFKFHIIYYIYIFLNAIMSKFALFSLCKIEINKYNTRDGHFVYDRLPGWNVYQAFSEISPYLDFQ